MEQDCTVSQSTADEIKSFQATESKGFPEGTHVSEPDELTGSAIKKCSQASKETETEKENESIPEVVPSNDDKDNCTQPKSKVDRRTAKERWSNPFCA